MMGFAKMLNPSTSCTTLADTMWQSLAHWHAAIWHLVIDFAKMLGRG
jgi:hypothetical protein